MSDWPWADEHYRRISGGAPYARGPTRDLRELYEKVNGVCFHCKMLTELTLERKDLQATRDHLIPKSRGGGEGANIVLSCYRCNQDKGSTMPSELEGSEVYSSAIEAAANAMRWKRRDLIARPLADIWTELAEAAIEAIGRFDEAIRRGEQLINQQSPGEKT